MKKPFADALRVDRTAIISDDWAAYHGICVRDYMFDGNIYLRALQSGDTFRNPAGECVMVSEVVPNDDPRLKSADEPLYDNGESDSLLSIEYLSPLLRGMRPLSDTADVQSNLICAFGVACGDGDSLRKSIARFNDLGFEDDDYLLSDIEGNVMFLDSRDKDDLDDLCKLVDSGTVLFVLPSNAYRNQESAMRSNLVSVGSYVNNERLLLMDRSVEDILMTHDVFEDKAGEVPVLTGAEAALQRNSDRCELVRGLGCQISNSYMLSEVMAVSEQMYGSGAFVVVDEDDNSYFVPDDACKRSELMCGNRFLDVLGDMADSGMLLYAMPVSAFNRFDEAFYRSGVSMDDYINTDRFANVYRGYDYLQREHKYPDMAVSEFKYDFVRALPDDVKLEFDRLRDVKQMVDSGMIDRDGNLQVGNGRVHHVDVPEVFFNTAYVEHDESSIDFRRCSRGVKLDVDESMDFVQFLKMAKGINNDISELKERLEIEKHDVFNAGFDAFNTESSLSGVSESMGF